MPIANVRGVSLNYEILGETGPFVALQPGGSRAGSSLRGLAKRSPRPATASSSTTGATPARLISRSRASRRTRNGPTTCTSCCARSTPCRPLSAAVRRVPAGAAPGAAAPEAVRGLLLWRVTGGAHAAEHLTNQYYTSHIEAARRAAWRRCAARPLERGDRGQPAGAQCADGVRPARFHRPHEPVAAGFPGRRRSSGDRISPAELRSMTMPACIAPGMDPVHPLRQARRRTV